MVPMPSPPQPPLEPDVTPAGVIEFGTEPAPRRRFPLADGLAGDRRTVPLAAALAAVAAFASLISEWQVTTMDGAAFGGDSVGDKMIPADLNDLGAAGTGYLIGLFPLVTAVVLTMFGPAAGRRYARLAGLSVGGTLLGLLLTMTVTLGEQSRIVSRLYTEQIDGADVTVGYGRGLWCALFAVAAALGALWLTERHQPAGGGEDVPAVWSWRRPRDEQADPRPEEPFELTVSSAQPFSPPDDDRDRNHRSGRPGISE
jgi:MFS family permease